MRKIFYLFLILLFSCLGLLAWADNSVTMANVSTGALSVMDIATNLTFGMCYVVGVILAFMTLVFFRRYRQNPVETPLSKVFWTFALATVVFVFPFVAHTVGIYETMEEASEKDPSTMS